MKEEAKAALDKIFQSPGILATVYEAVDEMNQHRAAADLDGITSNRDQLEAWTRRVMLNNSAVFRRHVAECIQDVPDLGVFDGCSGQRLYQEIYDRTITKLADLFIKKNR